MMLKMNDLTGQVILVTGAKGGLGAHVTKAFLNAGATVAGSSRSISATEFPHQNFVGISADLSDSAAAARLADEVVGKYGKIDSLVHVVGGFTGGQPIQETSDETWDAMMNMNARAVFHILRAVIPYMRKAGRGRVVAVGSRAGVEPVPTIAAYGASKAAMISLVRAAALENRDAGITANVILPGTIDTEENRKHDPQGKFSEWVSPDRIAELAVFLASDAGAQITGAAIPVYGFQ
jgi:NAD(P)-dependent dehydrogenase (short-subunit alcohol dehydrogenase family)